MELPEAPATVRDALLLAMSMIALVIETLDAAEEAAEEEDN